MSLTYGGTTYRSLEEQVRKNMEDISTEAASLSALTDKVDNLQTGGEKVSITFPAGASSGTVTDEQLATLQANDVNYIEMVNDKELYYLNDPGHEEGFLTYSHVGIENSKATIKTLTITVSAKSFVIVTTVVPTDAGGKLYKHYLNISSTQENWFNAFCTIYDDYAGNYSTGADIEQLFTRYAKNNGSYFPGVVDGGGPSGTHRGAVSIYIHEVYSERKTLIEAQGAVRSFDGTAPIQVGYTMQYGASLELTDIVTEL